MGRNARTGLPADFAACQSGCGFQALQCRLQTSAQRAGLRVRGFAAFVHAVLARNPGQHGHFAEHVFSQQRPQFRFHSGQILQAG